MPNPYKYKSQSSFMEDCMHQLRKVEKKPQDMSVAICLSMWKKREKHKKRKKKGTLESVSDKIAKIALTMYDKIAYPHFLIGKEDSAIDLNFEKLDVESIVEVSKDILNGHTIKIPVYSDLGNKYIYFNIKSVSPVYRDMVKDVLHRFTNINFVQRVLASRKSKPVFKYDKATKEYKRVKEIEEQEELKKFMYI